MKTTLLASVLIILLGAPQAFAGSYSFVTLDFPPLEFAGEDGKAKGIAVELVEKVMANLGHQVTIEIMPWARGLEMVKTGKADAIFTAYKTPEREEFLDYSTVVLIPQIVSLYAPKNSEIAFDGDLLKLKDKRFGVVSTISYGKTFDGLRDQLQTDRAENLESNLRKMLAGRVDLIISNMYVAESEIKKLNLQNDIKKLAPEVETVDSFIGFSKAKGLAALRDDFDRELRKLSEDGTTAQIMSKYGVTAK